ncbi:MAG: hypothetical protein ACFFBP_10575 [Promethearchaeota archaeon]
MELYKKAYKGIFIGRHAEKWKITGYSMEEVLDEFMEHLNDEEEGIIEIHQIDVETKKRTIVKRIIIVNDFFLNSHEEIPLKF